MDNIARLLIGKYNIQHFRFISFHKCEITIYFIRCYYNTGLSCVSNACACQSGYYWASSLSRCRMAYLFRSFSFKIFPLKLINLIQGQYQTYGQSCWSYQCDPSVGLTCPSSANGCSCPTYLSAYICDCPTSKYWSGSTCVSRVGNGAVCNAGQNYNCLFGSGMTCVNQGWVIIKMLSLISITIKFKIFLFI